MRKGGGWPLGEVDEVLSGMIRAGDLTLQIIRQSVQLADEVALLASRLVTGRAKTQRPVQDFLNDEPVVPLHFPAEHLSGFRDMARKLGLGFAAAREPDQAHVTLLIREADKQIFRHICEVLGVPEPAPDREPSPQAMDAGHMSARTEEGEEYVLTQVSAEDAPRFIEKATREDLPFAVRDQDMSPLAYLRDGEILEEGIPGIVRASGMQDASRLLGEEGNIYPSRLRAYRMSVPQYGRVKDKGFIHAAQHAPDGVLGVFHERDARKLARLLPDAQRLRSVPRHELEERLCDALSARPLTILIPAREKDHVISLLREISPEKTLTFEPALRSVPQKQALDRRIESARKRMSERHGARGDISRSEHGEYTCVLAGKTARTFSSECARRGIEVRNVRSGDYLGEFRFPDKSAADVRRVLEDIGSSARIFPAKDPAAQAGRGSRTLSDPGTEKITGRTAMTR